MPFWERFTRPNTLGTTRTNTFTDKRELDIGAIHRHDVKKAYYGAAMLSPRMEKRMLEGTATAESRAIGAAKVQRLDDDMENGVTPDAVKIGRTRIHVDSEFVSKQEVKWLQRKQSNIVNMQGRISTGQGEALARFVDEAYFIQGIKAGMMTQTAYTGLSAEEKMYGGTQHSIGAQTNLQSPDRIHDAISYLVAKIEDEKEMNVSGKDYVLYLRPLQWEALSRKVQVHDRQFDYSEGFSYKYRSIMVSNIEVVSCSWLPVMKNVTNHAMSNESNQSAFDGDFSKVWGVLIGTDAIFDGWNIPISTKVWDNEDRHTTIIETGCAFTVGVDDARHAAVLTID